MIEIKFNAFWRNGWQIGQREALFQLRKDHGWNAKFIAEKTGYKKRTVEGWFIEKSPVNPAAMKILSELRR